MLALVFVRLFGWFAMVFDGFAGCTVVCDGLLRRFVFVVSVCECCWMLVIVI